MPGPFVHDIDPIITSIAGIYLWWYGFSYTCGMVAGFLWLRLNRHRLAMDLGEVYRLTIYIAVGVLVGGRAVEVIFYEWAYYAANPWHTAAIWLGGMATHGILLGSGLALALYCRRYRRNLLEIADVLAIAAAFVMGFGRLGNFVDGQIVGALTDMPWGVKFPDAEGFRHPVVLYDGLKNLLIVPLLLLVRRTGPPRGALLAHFLLWYGLLRMFIDYFREYRTTIAGLPPGQEFNLAMALAGAGLLIWLYHRRRAVAGAPAAAAVESRIPLDSAAGLWRKRAVFLLLLLLPLIIPSDWTQDVPARYGARHPGLTYSKLYPPVRHPRQADDAQPAGRRSSNPDRAPGPP